MRIINVFRIGCVLLMLGSAVHAVVPIAKQAVLQEAASSSEVVVLATGIYHTQGTKAWTKKRDVRKNGLKNALLDAKRSALYVLLFSGTDPLLQTKDSELRFSAISEMFYSSSVMSDFIVFEGRSPKEKILMNNETSLKVLLELRINRERLRSYLEEQGVLEKRESLVEKMGRPMLMVLPQAKGEQSPLALLSQDENLGHAAGVIQSALTSRQYEVVLPDQIKMIQELSSGQYQLSDSGVDMSYQLAMSVGSDLYLDYQVTQSESDYDTQQFAVSIRAFETTTGRLLGAETGYSEMRKGADFLSIEEAVQNSLDQVLSRIMNYWKTDLVKGGQYKVLVRIPDNIFDRSELEQVQDSMLDVLSSMSNYTKESLITNATMDLIIWCDVDRYSTPRKVYRAIRDQFNLVNNRARLVLVNQNRKLVLMTLEAI
ncbi:MAG: hypothetical protein CL521_00455 [Actinobacteria bacterium]|nr:hypothetical protein [Actinomycetota bacterium]